MMALCACLSLGFASLQADSWAQIWTELEIVRGGKLSAVEASVIHRRLGETLRKGAEGPRADLLSAALEALAGRDASAAAKRMAALVPSPFSLRELWFLGDLMPAGAERARIVLAALGVQSPLADWQALLAWNTAVDEARALRLEETALPIQLRLHERYQATWSAADLAQTYTALGRMDAGREVLERAIERERTSGGDPAGLLEVRGIQALGFGDDTRGRDYLGLALAGGSDDAGLLLSRLDLQTGRMDYAQRGFQALLLGLQPSDGAWRGWGTTLLPTPFTEPATLKRVPPPQ